jgi:pimeloyl-ACP methyl ester carboxylesterase
VYKYNIQASHQAEIEFPPTGQFVSVENLQLHYICQGSGQPVVLLHGNAGFLQDYSPSVLNRLAQEYRVYAFDRPGHGYSDRPSQVATPLIQARLLRGALQRLGIKKPVLVGHSWGGTLVLAYALRYPDEISGIVLLAGLAYKFVGVPLPPPQIAQAPILDKVLKLIPSVPLGRILLKRILAVSFSPAPVPRNYLKAAQALWTRPSQVKAMFQDSTTLQPTLDVMHPLYDQIHLPVTIITGDVDAMVDPRQNAYPLHEAIAHSRLIVLPQVGHAIPQTQPEAIVNAIDAVMAEAVVE